MARTTPLKERTLYFSGVSEHFQAVAAAYRAFGQPAEALPLTTRDSLSLGMQASRGRECLFFVINLGDILQRSRQPNFDPERAAIWVPDISTKCVSVNFGTRHKQVLAEHDLGAIMTVTPVRSNDYEGFGESFREISDLSWTGIVAVDLLQQLQQSTRPYELLSGASDAAYQQGLARVVAATETGAIDAIAEALTWSGALFEAIPQDRSRQRPRVVLIGEYLLYNEYLNLDLVRHMEAMGGEVEVNRYYKLFYGITLGKMERAFNLGNASAYEEITAADNRQRALERRMVEPVKHLFTERQPYAASADDMRRYLRPHYNPEISNGAIDWGEGLELVDRDGGHGVIQLVPFLCLGAIVSASMGTRVRHDVGGVPWLDMVFDAQGTTNIRTRLEAFMHQAAQFQRSGARRRSSLVRNVAAISA